MVDRKSVLPPEEDDDDDEEEEEYDDDDDDDDCCGDASRGIVAARRWRYNTTADENDARWGVIIYAFSSLYFIPLPTTSSKVSLRCQY